MSVQTSILSVDEIRVNALRFSERWKNEKSEKSEAQTFINEFFKVFGLDRKTVADFEKHPPNSPSFIDCFWLGKFMIEMKSFGENLDEAMGQALDYYVQLEKNQEPRYILACDFQRWYLRDKKDNSDYFFSLSELSDNLGLFNFMTNRPKRVETHPVNIKATEMIGLIFDAMKASGYGSRHVEYFLTRLVFCLFADDTGIFGDCGKFQKYVEDNTKKDGSDLGMYLARLFDVLNKHADERSPFLDSKTRSFPYVNGTLFSETIEFPEFNETLRQLLINAGNYDWSKVSPAIFGNMFQTVMDQDARRELGAHYTSEENILNVIRPLFLDHLNEEFDKIDEIQDDSRKSKFAEFQDKLSNLTFFDPACGSGNFLTIAYREIRRLEMRVIMKIHGYSGKRGDTDKLSKVDVHQFYGIEKEKFSSKIAEISLWMMDHLMNRELSDRYGLKFRRIPIQKQPNIHERDALEVNWEDILSSSECSYILGNPPFGGAKVLTTYQRDQTKHIANLGKSGGTLDYVCGWFLKAGQYVNEDTPIGFVSTNSITQGEQVAQLWPKLLNECGLHIIFAYDQFKWNSESKGKAQVTVIILGLSRNDENTKRLFHHDADNLTEENPKYISPYLIGSTKNLPIVAESSKPLNGLPSIKMGSKPIDNGHYIFTDDEKDEFLKKEPNAKPFFKPFVNAKEFLNGGNRWILKLHDIKPNELMKLSETKKRVAMVKSFRLNSKSLGTKKLAETPIRYHLNVIPTKPFLVIPATTSERRDYIPMGYLKPPIIPSNALMIAENMSFGLFGILISRMHMVWVRTVGGKLKMDLRYSAGMIYNTFPIPDAGYDSLLPYAEKILSVRKSYPDSTLVDLYDPDTMPHDLLKAHQKLDGEVEKLYRNEPFESDHDRVEFLLSLYAKMIVKNKTLD